MNHYEQLGIDQDASPYQIKKAYRKLANQSHPDKGGSDQDFIKIKTAYDILSNPNKKLDYDSKILLESNQLVSHEAPLKSGFKKPSTFRKNKTVKIDIDVSIYDIIKGKTVSGSFLLSNNTESEISVVIPAGVRDGTSIRYDGLGDLSDTTLPRGDLIVKIKELPDLVFRRFHNTNDLIMDYQISIFDIITGTTLHISTPDYSVVDINIPNNFTKNMITIANHGLYCSTTNNRGDFHIKLQPIFHELDSSDISLINTIKLKYI